MGFLAEPRVPLRGWPQLTELMEEVRDLFIMESSTMEFSPLFSVPGLWGETRKEREQY